MSTFFTSVKSVESVAKMAYHWIRIFESQSEFENYIQPNNFVVFELRGEKICITRTDKGFYAVQEKCPHNGASLSKGFCTKENEIVCPLHRYSFDLKSGKSTSGGGYALRTYPIEIKTDGVYVGIKAKWWELNYFSEEVRWTGFRRGEYFYFMFFRDIIKSESLQKITIANRLSS